MVKVSPVNHIFFLYFYHLFKLMQPKLFDPQLYSTPNECFAFTTNTKAKVLLALDTVAIDWWWYKILRQKKLRYIC